MATDNSLNGPPRRILALVTTGGFTHAAPVLEICRVLASRGHTIEFTTCAGQEGWVAEYPFVSRVHSFAEGPSEAECEAHYRRMMAHDPAKGIGPVMKSKYLWDACWPDVYTRLKGLCGDKTTRPDFILPSSFIPLWRFILTFAKLSDIFGQRNVLLAALFVFGVASGLCAAAEKMSVTALVVFLALQGVGGSGVYSVVFVTLADICPARMLGVYSSVVSSVFAVANVLGPILGGAICDTEDWKWIFLLNVPGSAIAGAVIFFALPGGDGTIKSSTTSLFRRVDLIGSLLSIGGAVMIIYGLQTGGSERPWSDAQIIATIATGAVTVVLFFAYEHLLLTRRPDVEPVFPLRLLRNPRICILLLVAFFYGGVFYSVIVNIPQENQIVHLRSPTRAGVDVLPIMVLAPSASLLSGVPYSDGILARMYGYEAILGVGLGVVMPAFLVLGRLEVDDADNAVIMGAVNATRTMGGCICLSICSAILHSQQDKQLDFLPKDVLDAISLSPTSAIPKLPAAEALRTRETFHEIYKLQYVAIAGYAGAALFALYFVAVVS
ncbi:major facilitator superfamily domain-containing protein [Coniochaeta sp. 2T2.1]|nr:major facilitator superfamily domain-containing protein [Coniochaeta sp. 2T2.1]